MCVNVGWGVEGWLGVVGRVASRRHVFIRYPPIFCVADVRYANALTYPDVEREPRTLIMMPNYMGVLDFYAVNHSHFLTS